MIDRSDEQPQDEIRTDSRVPWDVIKWFKPSERWGSDQVSNEEALTRIEPELIHKLDLFRETIGLPIHVNNAVRNDQGTHGRGQAADIVIGNGIPVVDQFLLAEKSGLFSGIGVYPFWNRPGLHVDIRNLDPGQPGARWARNSQGVYVALSAQFLRGVR